MPPALVIKSSDQSMDVPERIAKLEAQVELIKEDVGELKADIKELHSRITTGNREILDKIDAMENRIELRMKENSESATRQHQQIEDEIKADLEFVSSRVDILERWRWVLIGAGAAVGFLTSHLEIFSKIFK